MIIESDGSETLPSNGVSGAISGSDASAAASTGTGDSAISDIKQNIDQVILKYVKEVSYMYIYGQKLVVKFDEKYNCKFFI